MLSGLFYLNSLSRSTFRRRGVWFLSVITMLFFLNRNVFNANNVDPDQMPRSAASGLLLHYLPTPFYKMPGITKLTSRKQLLIIVAAICIGSVEKTSHKLEENQQHAARFNTGESKAVLHECYKIWPSHHSKAEER